MKRRSEPPEYWRSLESIDEKGAELGNITLTTNHLHLPSGLDRGRLLFNLGPFAWVAALEGAEVAVLSSYKGDTSRPDYDIESLQSHAPMFDQKGSFAFLKKAEPGYAHVADVETSVNPLETRMLKVLSVAANTAEILHRISLSDDQSPTDPQVWATYLDKLYSKILPAVISEWGLRLGSRRVLKSGKYVAAQIVNHP